LARVIYIMPNEAGGCQAKKKDESHRTQYCIEKFILVIGS